MKKRLWLATILVFGALAIAVWGGLRARAARQFRASLDQAKQEIAAGRYGKAWKRLIELSNSGDAGGEVDYELGISELYRGHIDQARAAWKRVPSGGPFGARAALQCAMLAMSTGQLAHAEEMLQAAVRRWPGADSQELLRGLQLVLHLEGRTEDVRQAIMASWPDSETPAKVVQQLALLNEAPLALEATRRALEKGAEDDDRVWLARANLAIRTGQFERASEWLDRCAQRRPADSALWRARLELSRATGDKSGTWRALDQLPADNFSPADQLRLRAWLASRLGDAKAERGALMSLVNLEPGDTSALDRLAVLASENRNATEVTRLRAKRAEMMAALASYRALLRDDSIGDPADLARLALALGRPIEARGWGLMRDRKVGRPGPSRPGLAPLQKTSAADATSSALTLGQLFADLRRDAPNALLARAAGFAPRFVDDGDAAGLRFVHENGASALKRLPETMSGGIGLLDYDGDGWLDVYAVQSGAFPPPETPSRGDRLFRNRGDGTFEDVTERAGLHRVAGGYGHGVAVGDYDNDGHPDLFVTRWRSYALLRNRGDGSFEDVTTPAQLGGDRDWPTSAAWADLDADGDLDLYVCHYLVFDVTSGQVCADDRSQVNHYCSPRKFASLPDHVFRNDRGRFVDVTKAAGFIDPDGRGLGVVAADLDDDNRIDVYVANDMSANYLFRNLGGFQFEETAVAAGAAANSSGRFQSGMGIACGDLDGDGRPDLAVTNYYGESTTLFRNLGGGLFADDTASKGLAAPTRNLLGFGIAFLDANNDGRLDLISANGHVSNYEPAFTWKMPIQLLTGGPDGRLTDVSAVSGDPVCARHLGRGLATGDLDNDGRVDAVIQSQNEPLVYLQNKTGPIDHWLTLQLEGTHSNRDGVGARVVIEAGGVRQTQQRFGGGSYQSSGDPRLHFGLGQSTLAARVEVRWPSGQVDRYDELKVDRGYLVREGAPTATHLPGWNRLSD
jgi:tetratricopeptide (TPR) repeat protein